MGLMSKGPVPAYVYVRTHADVPVITATIDRPIKMLGKIKRSKVLTWKNKNAITMNISQIPRSGDIV